jgi:uridine kinase|uniref:uridine kinase n=1 Tax=Orrella sp. TaxID=1921583 RepID=UPI004048A13D
MKKMLLQPMFMTGLVIRLVLIVCMSPLAVTQWFAPFLDVGTSVLTLDPWLAWIAGEGAPVAFPYGYAMWVVFLPMTLVAKLVGLPLLYAHQLTLLVADFCLLLTLCRLLPDRQRLLLLAYWLSPIVILASYGLGLNDLIPALLLCLSIIFVRQIRLKLAGVLLAAAISAKLSMVVALPFFAIYLFNNRALRKRLANFLSGFGLSILLLGGSFFVSAAGIQMVLGNPQMGKIYQLAIGLAGNVSIYIVPLIYFIMLYLAWRVRRLNFDLFQATTGMAFLLIVLMSPASPGWFVWCLPFLALYQAMSGRMSILLVSLFSAAYVLSTLLVTPLQFANGREFALGVAFHVTGQLGSHAASTIHTGMVAIGLVLAIRIWREAISRNDFFRLSRKPFVVGVAGDSGAGKDTFADAITGLFGEHSVVKLSGDDYHLWDRQKPMWQVMTHLNPMANDIEGFCNDLVSLIDGRSVVGRHYDHQIGRMSKPFLIESNDFIIASGLHALYLPIIREYYNLKIYLEIDEGLRRHFKLKRDVQQRGHTVERVLSSFKKREPDSERFIRPQSNHADLIFSLQPIHSRMLEEFDYRHPIRLKLVVETKAGFTELSIHRVLVGVCGLHIDILIGNDGTDVKMTIEGEVLAADVAMAAEILCPRVLEFLDIPPKWQDGMLGLMQLITLSHISQVLSKRFI